MNKITLFLIIIALLLFLNQSISFAGQIQELNINSTGGSTVKVNTGNNTKINNINIKKDPKSNVIIDNKEIDCNEGPSNSSICKP